MLPEMQKITAEDMRKIFPVQFTKKYGQHTYINDYETRALREEVDDEAKSRPIRHIEIPQVPARKQYHPRFETTVDLIDINKKEESRMSLYTKVLSMKLNISPERKGNFIRSPPKESEDLDENVLGRLKAIEDLEYERILKANLKRKQMQDKKLKCKFVQKIKSNQPSPRKSNPEDSKNTTQLEKLPTKSRSLAQLRGNSEQRRKLLNGRNYESLIKKLQRRKETEEVEEKRDLIKQTQRIRQETNAMETLHFYQALLLKRKRKQMLNIL